MVPKITWFTRCALMLLVLHLTACPEPPQPPPPPQDSIVPSTRANPPGGTYSSAQTVTLTCDDGSGSGCDATYYTTDGSNPTGASTRYANPISIRSTTTLKFFSADKAGNSEAVRTETYTINLPPTDTQAPTTTAAPAGGTYRAAQSVTLTCADGTGSGCANTYYTTDGTEPTASSTRYTAPIAIAASTTLKFFSVDQAGNQEAVRTETYVIDTQAPTTTAAPAGGTYRAAQTVTLTCADGTGTGCANTYFTTDGTEPTTSSTRYTAPVAIAASTTLKFFSVDQAGNSEAVRTATYVIDTQAPATVATPLGGNYNAAQSITLTCSDGSGTGCAGTYYTTDGSTPTTSSTPYVAPISLFTTTTLRFFSVDQAGNAEPVRTETYVFDTQAPTTTAAPAGGTYGAAQSVTLTCADGTGTGCANTYFTTDGTEPTTSSTPYTAAIAIAANTTLKFFSVDQAGNSEAVRTQMYVIDTQAPTTTASPAGGTYDEIQTVRLECSDGAGGSGCANTYYTVDGSDPTTSSLRYTAPFDLEGTTTLKFFSVDSVGNQEQIRTQSYVINVPDTRAPTTTATPAGGSYNAAQSVTLSCSDGVGGSGCANTYYTTNGSDPTTGSDRYTAPISIASNTTLKFFSVDNEGNQEQIRTATYVIDTQAPTTTASPAGGTYGTARDVTLACSDEGGSSCANTYYTTDGTEPTTSSTRYTAPIALTANTTLKFFSVDGAGNAEAVRTETYVIDTTAPTTTATPAGGAYNTAQSVTLACSDGTGGTGCTDTYYTVDGSDPTPSSERYTAPIAIGATTTLKFFSVDSVGNREQIRTATYVIDSQAPITTASLAGGRYDTEQTVTLTCEDGSGDSSSGCANTYYTTDGSTPTTGSTRYTSPLSLQFATTLRFFSVDRAGNQEAVRTQVYDIFVPANISGQIAAVRAAANGAINLPITGAVVTYARPLIGTDPAGFFLQAERNGPAIFVAVDPTTLTPPPAVGDRVAFTATQRATQDSQVRVTTLSGYSRLTQGESIEALRAEISSVDFSQAAALNDLESELISISGTINSNFGGAGTDHLQATLTALGTPTGTNLRLRAPTTLVDQLDLANGCNVGVNSPLWRFTTTAQPSIWKPSDLAIAICPAPKVISAAATASNAVTVRFDRRLNPTSVLPDGSQFTFTSGLVATAATVVDREVRVTTNAQSGGAPYVVTVATSVQDTYDTPLDSTAATASFTGFQSPATLRITEVAPNISSQRDLVELVAIQGGTVAGFTLVHDTTVLATLPPVQVATGDVIVIHLNPDRTSGFDAPDSETTSRSQYPNATHSSNYDNAWDFHGGTTGITYSGRVLRIRDPSNVTQDGAGFTRPTGNPSTYPAQLQSLQAEGQWSPANCSGQPCDFTTSPSAIEVSANWDGVSTSRATSVRRTSATDTNTRNDWAVGASSFGLPNP